MNVGDIVSYQAIGEPAYPAVVVGAEGDRLTLGVFGQAYALRLAVPRAASEGEAGWSGIAPPVRTPAPPSAAEEKGKVGGSVK
jgi:hypothetical protein